MWIEPRLHLNLRAGAHTFINGCVLTHCHLPHTSTLGPRGKRRTHMKTMPSTTPQKLARRRGAPRETRSDPPAEATPDIAGPKNPTLADVFAFYQKTKNFHGPLGGPH